jgi:hypothetical protein
MPSMAFTCRSVGRLSVLESDVELFAAFLPPAVPSKHFTYKALYDTGATHSAISPKVVADLALASVGDTIVGVGGGDLPTTSHLVNIGLPNHVMFPMVRVAKVTLHRGVDAVIGMDILAQGDFSVTNYQGKTTFSFCFPSRREIDFVGEIREDQKITQAHSAKISRNSPCPCGSGKKYKRCCGAGIAQDSMKSSPLPGTHK